MAARKHHQRKVVLNDHEGWKQAIQTRMLVNRLNDHVNGKVDLKPTQLEAIKVLLKKTAPDLSSVSVGQDEALGPVQISWQR